MNVEENNQMLLHVHFTLNYPTLNCEVFTKLLSSGIVAERVDLRVFLTAGLLGSGLMTVMFGAAHSLGIHSVWYLVTVQLLAGLIQVTEGTQGQGTRIHHSDICGCRPRAGRGWSR